jgi:D-xylose transport system substrate-binding protein
VRDLSPAAMDMAISLAQGEEVGDLTEFSLAELTLDENMEGSVPCRFLPVVQVTDENVYEEVILTGFQPYDEVYADVPEDERPPRP